MIGFGLIRQILGLRIHRLHQKLLYPKTTHNRIKFVERSAKEVSSFLRDFMNLKELHPLIEKIVESTETPHTQAPNYIRKYLITDKLYFCGMIPYRINYSVTVLEESDIHIRSIAEPGFGIKLTTTYYIRQQFQQARVQETTSVEANWLMFQKVYKDMSSSHTQMLLNLKKHLEAKPASKP